MKFSSLREILVKRTDNLQLQNLIKNIADDSIQNIVLESLEKMARKGSSANHAVTASSGHVLPVEETHPHESMDAALVHDNLSHHLTNYKAALKSGNRDVADKHLEQAMKTINYATKLEGATARKSNPEGAVRIRSGSTRPFRRDEKGTLIPEREEGQHLISPSAWEMNYSGSERRPNGVLKEVTKGWNRQTTKGHKAEDMFPDYKYLEIKPHPHANAELYGHDQSAYPFHDLQVNGRYVDIDDNAKAPTSFAEHPLDSHPGRNHAYTHSTDIGTTASNKFMEDHKDWMNSPAAENWLKDQEQKHEDTNYAKRGSTSSNPIHFTPEESKYDLASGRRALKSGVTKPTPNNEPTKGVAPAGPVDTETAAATTPNAAKHAAIINKLAVHLSPEKIASALGLTTDEVNSVMRKK